MIEGVQHQQGKQLRGLIAQRQALCLVDVDAQQVINARVDVVFSGDFPQFCFQNVVVDAGKEMPDVALQNPAIGSLILRVVAHKALFQPDYGVCGALSALVRAVIPHKAGRDGIVQTIVCDGVQNNLILKCRGFDVPFLRLENFEALKLPRLINAV